MKRAVSIIFILILSIFYSCSDSNQSSTPFDNGQSEETTLSFRFTATNPSDFASRADSAVLTISSSDLDELLFPLEVTDNGVEGSIQALIAGEDRTFTISIFDTTTKLQYQGSITLDVLAGSMNSLPISLKRIFYGREADSIALVAIDKASNTDLWDWEKPLHDWNGIVCGENDTDRVTQLNTTARLELSYVPSEIANLTELTYLNLHYGSLSTLPEAVTKLTKLKHIFLGGNKFTQIPSQLFEITSLETILLNSNEISTVSSDLDQLTKLTKLDLSQNTIVDTVNLPATLENLRILVLNDNNMSSLPEAVCSYSRLQEIYLDNNKLTSLPESLGKLDDLIILKAANNALESLPTSLTDCERLQHLEIQSNSISALPDKFGTMKSLINVNLTDNNLSYLPENFSQLTQLFNLYISGNALQFGELEKINCSKGFYFDPQDSIGSAITSKNSSPFVIGIHATGTNNKYQWFRDGVALSEESDSLKVNRSGTYTCTVTNDKFITKGDTQDKDKPLSLHHRPITVVIEDTIAPGLEAASLTIKGLSQANPLSDTNMVVYDNITPKEEIAITITKIPLSGYLHTKDIDSIAVGFECTFGDIIAGDKLFYTNYSTTSEYDSFSFILKDNEGNESEEQVLPITYF